MTIGEAYVPMHPTKLRPLAMHFVTNPIRAALEGKAGEGGKYDKYETTNDAVTRSDNG